MTLRISEIADKGGTTFRVDGRLLGNAVAELARASTNAAPPLTLDLSGLLFADSEGVGALQQLRAHGATLRNVPPYVSLLLEMEVTRHHSRNAGADRAVPLKQID
jgi:anti-anti-sigma regulatory factor